MKKGMIKVSVVYPNTDDIKFDLNHYLDHHVPLVSFSLGYPLHAAGGMPGSSGSLPKGNLPFSNLPFGKF